jgi:hypothetical protein
MRKGHLFLILLLLYSVSACKKDQAGSEILAGNWQWQISYKGGNPLYPNTVTTPAPGDLYILSFENNGSFRYTNNDAIIRSGTYKLILQKKHSSDDKAWFIDFSDEQTLKLIVQSDSMLVLGSEAIGGGTEHYKRL